VNQRDFVERGQPLWERYERALDALSRRGGATPGQPPAEEFPSLYRRLCQQLALAQERHYATALTDRLNTLVLRGHQQLYRAHGGGWRRLLQVFAADFPARVRGCARTVALAAALFTAPAIGVGVAVAVSPRLAYEFAHPAELERFEHMYDPASPHFARERESDSDFMMFGHYIRNNIGIGFQTFAGGMLFGVGSAFYLVFNGGFFGLIGAHLFNAGFGATFSAFVITHGAFELTAIVLAGAAGLELGLALLAPGRRTRSAALRRAAGRAVVLVYGVVGMLLIAAFVEAFWSSSVSVPTSAKYAVGTACWCAVAWYFLRAGRSRGSR